MTAAGRSAPTITSVRNARVVAARRLHRSAERRALRRFLAEGPQAAGIALAEGVATELFLTAAAAARHPGLVERALGVPVRWVSAEVLAAIAETRAPQGVVAVARIEVATAAGIAESVPGLVAILAGVADPGNVGTIVRTADAAGAGGVVLAGGCADVWGGKSVRASAGSVLHLPLAPAGATPDTITVLRAAGLRIVAADIRGEAELDTANLAGPTAWVFGNEARGLPDDLLAAADTVVRVPIHGRAESLSVAAAAAVCLYASARTQRKPREH